MRRHTRPTRADEGQIVLTCPKALGLNAARRDRGLATTLDHRGERSSRKAIDQVWSARIHIHHAGGDTDPVETRLDHQWVELSADQCVAASLALKLYQALDRRMGRGAIGIEVGRSVIAQI